MILDASSGKTWLRVAAYLLGVATVLLVLGYLTADQWLAVVKGVLG